MMKFDTFRNFIAMQSLWENAPSKTEVALGLGVDYYSIHNFFTEGIGDIEKKPIHFDGNDIKFLQQFHPDSLWGAALYQRYKMLFDILIARHKTLVEDYEYDKLVKLIARSLKSGDSKWSWRFNEYPGFEGGATKDFFSDAKIKNLEKLDAETWSIYDVNEEAQHLANKYFDAFVKIDWNKTAGEKDFALQDRRKKIIIKAKPYLKELHDKLIDSGFDLSNPQIECKTGGDCDYPEFITTGLKWPTYNSINRTVAEYKNLMAHQMFGKVPDEHEGEKIVWKEPKGSPKDSWAKENLEKELINHYVRLIRNNNNTYDDPETYETFKFKDMPAINKFARRLARKEIIKRAEKGELYGAPVPSSEPETAEQKEARRIKAKKTSLKFFSSLSRSAKKPDFDAKKEILSFITSLYQKDTDLDKDTVALKAKQKYEQLVNNPEVKNKIDNLQEPENAKALAELFNKDIDLSSFLDLELDAPSYKMPHVQKKIKEVNPKTGEVEEKTVEVPYMLPSHGFALIGAEDSQSEEVPEDEKRGHGNNYRRISDQEFDRSKKHRLAASFDPNAESAEELKHDLLDPEHHEKYLQVKQELEKHMVDVPENYSDLFTPSGNPKINTIDYDAMVRQLGTGPYYANIVAGMLKCFVTPICSQATNNRRASKYANFADAYQHIKRVIFDNLKDPKILTPEGRFKKAYSTMSAYIQRPDADEYLGSRKRERFDVRGPEEFTKTSDDGSFEVSPVDKQRGAYETERQATYRKVGVAGVEGESPASLRKRALAKAPHITKSAEQENLRSLTNKWFNETFSSEQAIDDLVKAYAQILVEKKQLDPNKARLAAGRKITDLIDKTYEKISGKSAHLLSSEYKKAIKNNYRFKPELQATFFKDPEVADLLSQDFEYAIKCPVGISAEICGMLTKSLGSFSYGLGSKTFLSLNNPIFQRFTSKETAAEDEDEREYSEFIDLFNKDNKLNLTEKQKANLQKSLEEIIGEINSDIKTSEKTPSETPQASPEVAQTSSLSIINKMNSPNYFSNQEPSEIAKDITMLRKQSLDFTEKAEFAKILNRVRQYFDKLDIKLIDNLFDTNHLIAPEYASKLASSKAGDGNGIYRRKLLDYLRRDEAKNAYDAYTIAQLNDMLSDVIVRSDSAEEIKQDIVNNKRRLHLELALKIDPKKLNPATIKFLIDRIQDARDIYPREYFTSNGKAKRVLDNLAKLLPKT